MLIPVNFRYDPAESPKVEVWINQRKGKNLSEHIRRAIESDYDQVAANQKDTEEQRKLKDDIRKLFAEVERLKAGAITRPQAEQAEIFEVEKQVEKVVEESDIEVNVGALRSRYFKGGNAE